MNKQTRREAYCVIVIRRDVAIAYVIRHYYHQNSREVNFSVIFDNLLILFKIFLFFGHSFDIL